MANTSTSPMLSPELVALQRVVAGRYSIVRELGRGGMGVVFLARDAALERPVAIKLLPPLLAMDAAHRARFVREARIAAALSHPHIVPIHAVEEHDDLAFFVMGFVDGETLAARVARSGPLRVAEAIRITQEVAWALAHAHGHGVIHRDVKPDNILIERDSGRAIVTDFGIARADNGPTSSSPGAIVGTPRYMSPEQSRGDAVDGRSDVYSLGAVAYFALTGNAPIDGDSSVAILARKAIAAAPPVATMRDGVPPKFAAAIDRCLATDAAARWDSAEAFAVALRSTTTNEIPAPVRRFVREADRAGSEIATALTASAVSFCMSVVSVVALGRAPGFGGDLIKIMYLAACAVTTGLAGLHGALLVGRARRLIQAGYGHSAVRPALLAAEGDEGMDARRPAPRTTALYVVLAVAGTAGSFMLGDASGFMLPFAGFAGSVAIPMLLVRRLLSSRRGTDSWWSRMLRGKVGRGLFRVASIGLRDRTIALPAAGEPTSLALRTELTALFDALPAVQRSAFTELPSLAVRLERQAEALRERTPNPETDRRLQSVVAALEMLRLDLLRLNAAAIDAGDLTRDLDDARRISDDIDARLQANEELRRLLRSDANQTPTPT